MTSDLGESDGGSNSYLRLGGVTYGMIRHILCNILFVAESIELSN